MTRQTDDLNPSDTEPASRNPAIPKLAARAQIADYLNTTVDALAQMRYRRGGPLFIKAGNRVRYRWSDVLDWLEHNTDDAQTGSVEPLQPWRGRNTRNGF